MVLPVFQKPVRMEVGGVPGLEGLLPLLRLERHEFAAVLGQPVEVAGPSDAEDHTWRVVIDPHVHVPQLQAETQRKSLTSVVPGPDHFGDTLNLLHTLAHSPNEAATFQETETYGQAAERIDCEVANTYPSFELRGLDWEEISARYAGIGRLAAEDFWRQARRWVAALGDAHTAVIPPGARQHPPYVAEMTATGARLLKVPESSAAYCAGVRAGWTIQVEQPAEWLAVTGASQQHRTIVAARRYMEMTTTPRRFTARGPTGEQTSWDEAVSAPGPSVIRSGPSIRIHRFDGHTPALLAEALRLSTQHPEITVDLRGNIGGSLEAADLCRRMLIPEAGSFGSIRYSDGRGGLSPSYALQLEPVDVGFRGRVRALVDAITYSAAEDFLQPLVGLDHVHVEGGPTGGGSGRARTVPLKDGYRLRVSTAITYTRDGQPIEYLGLGG